MEKSYEVLKSVIDKVGAKVVASKLGLSQSMIYKWCQESEDAPDKILPSGAANPLDRIQIIYELTKDPELINWICQMAQGYYVKNPSEAKINVDTKVLKNIHRFIKEFSETLDAISQSYADKKITQEEAKGIRKEWEELKRIGEGFVTACEQGKFN